MKKLLYLLPVLFLASCKADSAFGYGLWFIPLALGAGAAYSAYKYYKTESKGALVYGIILAVATIVSILLMLNDK